MGLVFQIRFKSLVRSLFWLWLGFPRVISYKHFQGKNEVPGAFIILSIMYCIIFQCVLIMVKQ